MELKFLFGLASSVLAVVCFAPYFRDIFKRKTLPHTYSWLVWTILQTLGVMAQLKEGAGYGAWSLGIGAIFCFAIFILSFKYGTKNISKFDGLCLFASFCAFVIYFGIANPIWAVISISIIDFVGFLPTFRKGFEEPYTETISTFAMSAVTNILSLIALQNYNMTTVLYIACLFITNSSFVVVILLRRRVLGREFGYKRE